MNRAKNKLILIVDDERDVRDFLSAVLEDAGFRVALAKDGDEALQKVNEERPDLISLDLVMPRRSGIKFLHELRRNKSLSSVPVMIVTGHARDELGSDDLGEIMAGKVISGPRCYLEKPINPNTLVNAVKRELDVEVATDGEPEPEVIEMRKNISELVDKTDPETLEKLMRILKEKS